MGRNVARSWAPIFSRSSCTSCTPQAVPASRLPTDVGFVALDTTHERVRNCSRFAPVALSNFETPHANRPDQIAPSPVRAAPSLRLSTPREKREARMP